MDKDDINFNNVHDSVAAQEIDLAEDPDAEIWNPLRCVPTLAPSRIIGLPSPAFSYGRPGKFTNVHSLTVFFVDSFSGDSSRIYFLGLRGTNTGVRWSHPGERGLTGRHHRPSVLLRGSSRRVLQRASCTNRCRSRRGPILPEAIR